MKAASLLEHKCFFLVFVFTGQQYIKIQLKRVFTPNHLDNCKKMFIFAFK